MDDYGQFNKVFFYANIYISLIQISIKLPLVIISPLNNKQGSGHIDVVREKFLSIKDILDLEYRVLYFSIMEITVSMLIQINLVLFFTFYTILLNT